MAKIRKKKLKNKRLVNFFRCPEGQRTEREGRVLTGSRCTAAACRTGQDEAEEAERDGTSKHKDEAGPFLLC